MNTKPKLFLIQLDSWPIYDQLVLEEKLLRGDSRNFCILNVGSPTAVVMGISRKPQNDLHDSVYTKQIPIIKRFSGGGTVVIDPDTFFCSLIMNKKECDFAVFPEKIMLFTESIFQKAIPELRYREKDFVIGDKKCAGNAQYLTKDRFIHHTSFLFDFQKENMDLLQIPDPIPEYRKNRSHLDFLTTLKAHGYQKNQLNRHFEDALEGFDVKNIDIEGLKTANSPSVRLSSKILEKNLIHLKTSNL